MFRGDQKQCAECETVVAQLICRDCDLPFCQAVRLAPLGIEPSKCFGSVLIKFTLPEVSTSAPDDTFPAPKCMMQSSRTTLHYRLRTVSLIESRSVRSIPGRLSSSYVSSATNCSAETVFSLGGEPTYHYDQDRLCSKQGRVS